MGKQIIVAISRSYGSGGHEIGRKLAAKLGIGFLDREILDNIAEKKGVSAETLHKYDEKRRNPLTSRTVRGFSNSPEDAVAEMQFDYLREKAREGESFVIIGRCGGQVLRDYEGLVNIYITGDYETRIERVITHRKCDRSQARGYIHKHDRSRRAYNNHYDKNHTDIARYDLLMNSSKLGIDGTVDFLYSYIQAKGLLDDAE